MKKIHKLVLALMLIGFTMPAIADDVFPPDFLGDDRTYRVIWDYDTEEELNEPTSVSGPLSLEEGFLAGLGGDGAPDPLAAITTDFGAGRVGVVADDFGNHITSNFWEEGETIIYRVQVTTKGALDGDSFTVDGVGDVFLWVYSIDSFDTGGLLEESEDECFFAEAVANDLGDGIGTEAFEFVGVSDVGDGFITVAIDIVVRPENSETGDLSCLIHHFSLEAGGASIDQVIIDAAYFFDPTVVVIDPNPIAMSEGNLIAADLPSSSTFTVVLSDEIGDPASDTVLVTLDPNTDDVALDGNPAGDGIVLTFTTLNWDTPKTVSISVNDDIEVEDCFENAIVSVISATVDPNSESSYNGGRTNDLIASVLDNESSCVVVTPTEVEVNEIGDTEDPGNQATYGYVLNKSPGASNNVIVTAEFDDGVILVDPASFTFTDADWSALQDATVSAVDNEEIILETIIESGAIFSDPNSDPNAFANEINPVIALVTNNECGAIGILPVDLNEDCYVNLLDFSIFSVEWAVCTEPDETNCP